MHEPEPEIGGKYRMSFRNFKTGNSQSFGGEFKDRVPGERLVHADRLDDPNLPGELEATNTLKAVSVGAEMSVAEQGVPDLIPLQACYLGWLDSLRKLAKLVEPEINQ